MARVASTRNGRASSNMPALISTSADFMHAALHAHDGMSSDAWSADSSMAPAGVVADTAYSTWPTICAMLAFITACSRDPSFAPSESADKAGNCTTLFLSLLAATPAIPPIPAPRRATSPTSSPTSSPTPTPTSSSRSSRALPRTPSLTFFLGDKLFKNPLHPPPVLILASDRSGVCSPAPAPGMYALTEITRRGASPAPFFALSAPDSTTPSSISAILDRSNASTSPDDPDSDGLRRSYPANTGDMTSLFISHSPHSPRSTSNSTTLALSAPKHIIVLPAANAHPSDTSTRRTSSAPRHQSNRRDAAPTAASLIISTARGMQSSGSDAMTRTVSSLPHPPSSSWPSTNPTDDPSGSNPRTSSTKSPFARLQ